MRESFVGATFESAVDVAVCEGERLLGLVPIERLLAADAETPLREIMEEAGGVVRPSVDLEVAASRTVRRKQRTLAVLDDEGRFLGLIPPQEVLAVLVEEHEEDLARLGGFVAGTSRARSASEEAVGRRLLHRFPWLLLGLVGAMASAGIVASFEDQLRTQVLLAFFVPAVVYMADAVGTQTEAVVIRGIAVGVPIAKVVGRELVTGLVIGTFIAATFFPFALLIWDESRVAASVAIALSASCSTATVVAVSLPYALNRLGRDPAFGSGPLATVIQDLLSIIIYFAVASTLVH